MIKINKTIFIFFYFVISQFTCENPSISTLKTSHIPEVILIDENLKFTMGCLLNSSDWIGFSHEAPPFEVILSPFYISKYEVRNDEYNYFVTDGGYCDSSLWSEAGWKYIQSEGRTCPVDWTEGNEPWINREFSNTSDRPINNITWYEAEAYCNWLSQVTGEHYSLPTEAQWERAARGPDPGLPFVYGNIHDSSKYNNMMYSNKLFPVGHYKNDKTYNGCYDMAGNLMEFCADLYELHIYQDYKKNEPVHDPEGPDSNYTGQRSIRGAITIFHPDPDIEYQITTFRRMACFPEDYYQIYGFRIVKNKK